MHLYFLKPLETIIKINIRQGMAQLKNGILRNNSCHLPRRVICCHIIYSAMQYATDLTGKNQFYSFNIALFSAHTSNLVESYIQP